MLACLAAWSATAALVAHATPNKGADPAWTGSVSYVVDGDSLWVRAERGRVKLRLQGIDAPEICQSFGRASRDALRGLALGQEVRVTVHARDRWGRAIASVRLLADGRDLATTMVREGWAWSDRWGWRRGRLDDDEARARQAGLGLFAHGTPERPADFRRRHGPCGGPGARGAR